MDYAQLSIHSIQSVSDQTDYRLNAIIAAALRLGGDPGTGGHLELSFEGSRRRGDDF